MSSEKPPTYSVPGDVQRTIDEARATYSDRGTRSAALRGDQGDGPSDTHSRAESGSDRRTEAPSGKSDLLNHPSRPACGCGGCTERASAWFGGSVADLVRRARVTYSDAAMRRAG